jgi:hypothetical protein
MAVDRFRSLVLGAVGSTLREDVPAVFKINYAVALLAAGDFQRFLTVWPIIRRESSPSVKKLEEALRKGKANLSLWQKLKWWTGLSLSYPVRLDFPLGELS